MDELKLNDINENPPQKNDNSRILRNFKKIQNTPRLEKLLEIKTPVNKEIYLNVFSNDSETNFNNVDEKNEKYLASHNIKLKTINFNERKSDESCVNEENFLGAEVSSIHMAFFFFI